MIPTQYGGNLRMIHITADGVRDVVRRLTAAGGTLISLVDHWYCELDANAGICEAPPDWESPGLIWREMGQAAPARGWANSADLGLVEWAARHAAGQGLTVLLKPHLDWIRGGFRGEIRIPTARRRDFTMAYKAMLLPYIGIANRTGAGLCIGTELKKVTEDLGSEWWIEIARWAKRKAPRVPLTYAANWGAADDAEYKRQYPLWRCGFLAAAGIDAYFPMVSEEYTGPVDRASIRAAWHRRLIEADWCPRIDDSIEAIPVECGIPVWVTELGYPNAGGLAPLRQPWAIPDGAALADQPQADALSAARDRWAGTIGRIYYWELGHPGVTPYGGVSHDITRTGALARLALAP